jgi:hypothetical protein
MNITINLIPFIDFFNQPAHLIIIKIGWLPVLLVLLWGFKEMWIHYIQSKWSGMQKYMFLAIDIPRGNEQSPKAVENLFSYLAGAHTTFNLIEKYWEGRVQLSFSLEIASIDGYTQFLIRTPIQFRDLVESAVYSQYPDAEITEVDDYTKDTPSQFPDEQYDAWGTEFIQKTNSAYPIKTYEEFEHQLGDPESTYRDTMATLMDLTSSLKKGEQLWYQLIIVPIGFDWPEIGDAEVAKILNEKDGGKKPSDKIIDKILYGLERFSENVYELWKDIEDKEDKKDEPFKMMNLKPREKKKVESVYKKTGKLGFEFKIRFVYMSRKEVMNKAKVVNGFVGFMKQFADMDLNNLKPDMDITATSTHYFYREKRLNIRKNKIVKYYKSRNRTAGRTRGILNIEELATLWHFPVASAVKAPLIQKASRKKAEPPMSLPIMEPAEEKEVFWDEELRRSGTNGFSAPAPLNEDKLKNEDKFKEEILIKSKGEKKGTPPPNLPVV